MKKRVLKIMSAFVLAFSFFLSGCISTGDASSFEAPSGEVQGASDNANEVMKTANNVTYYYNNLIDLNNDKGLEAIDRNMVDNCFSAVYLFVDPGSEQEYTDHFSETTQPFYRLVDREIDILAQALYQLIDKVYITGQSTPAAYIAGNVNGEADGTFQYDTANISIPLEKQIKINDLQIFDAATVEEDQDGSVVVVKKGEDQLDSSVFDLGNIATYKYVSNAYNSDTSDANNTDDDMVTEVNSFYVEKVSFTITVDDSPVTVEAPINNYMINLTGAIFGGYKLETLTSVTDGDDTYTVPGYVNFSASEYNGGDYEWEMLTTYGQSDLQNNLTNELKYRIAAAVAGKEITGAYDSSKYIDILKAIDHTGFTEQDQANIVTQILTGIIGEEAMELDNSFAAEINQFFDVSEGLCVDDMTDYESLFVKETAEANDGIHTFQNFKAYQIIIPELVRQAMTISCTHTTDGGFTFAGDTETLLPGFPRLQIMVADPRLFMDAVGYEEENDGEVGDYEDIDPDEIPTDTEGTEFTKKLLQSINLKAVLFLPKQLYGERTMAQKDGDTWVEDEDGEQVYDVFKVEGFVVTDMDVVLLADEGNKAVVQGNYTTKITNKDAEGNKSVIVQQKQSEAFEVGNESPDPTAEDSYSSTTFLEIDGTELIAKKEDEAMSDTNPTTVQNLRMQGYNGMLVTELGIIMDMSTGETGNAVSMATFTQVGLYKMFTLSTDMYKYLTVDSVVGEGAGYSLNIDKFAGDNYVLADFSVLEVNDDETNRDCKFNILYLSCETA